MVGKYVDDDCHKCWIKKPLGELVKFNNGVAHEKCITENGKYIVVNSKFISSEGNVKKFSDLCLEECIKNDILLVMSDVPNGKAIAKCFFVDKSKTYTLNQRICRLTSICANPKFLFYAVNRHPYFLSFDDGVQQTNLTKSNILNCIISLPNSITEQQEIAKALSDMDELIASLEKLIAKKKAIKQGAMQKLLTGKKRLPGFNGEWYLTTIGKHCRVYDGTHQTPHYVENGVPFYSVENVTADDFEHTKFISKKEYLEISSKCRISKGDVLMTRIGSIGDCKYISWDKEAGFYVSLALIKCNDIDAQFLSYYSHSPHFLEEIKIRSLITAIPQKINLGPISQITIEVPKDIKEQRAIASVLSDMDVEIEALEQKLAKCCQTKQGMMQQLLTGKIRLV